MQASSRSETHMQELCVPPYLTLPHIVPFRIAKARLKVVHDVLERLVLLRIEFVLDIVQGYWVLDHDIVVGILSFRGQTHELERGDLAPRGERGRMSESADMVVGGKKGVGGGLGSKRGGKPDKSRTPC